jgi:hypothetical protein
MAKMAGKTAAKRAANSCTATDHGTTIRFCRAMRPLRLGAKVRE